MEKQKAIIFDLDGTLCDVEHRVHFVKKKPPEWENFNSHLVHDLPYTWCVELIEAMRSRHFKILFVTGRGEEYRSLTLDWFKKHGIVEDVLFMRKHKDFREDAFVKEEIYLNDIANTYNVLFVVDDRKSVVAKWRELGLVCLQCAPGDF